jgi:hypothetical protein
MLTRQSCRLRMSARHDSCLTPLVEERGDLLARPDVIAQAGRHRRGPGIGLGEALVGPREVVVQEVDRLSG